MYEDDRDRDIHFLYEDKKWITLLKKWLILIL